jgi:hypothetical protein
MDSPADTTGGHRPGQRLTELESLPEGLLDLPATQVHDRLGGPTLIHLPGERTPPLFVSVRPRGNDAGGWDASRALLTRHPAPLPRALSLFVATQATPSSIASDDGVLATLLQTAMRRRGVHAAIDLESRGSTGPPYAEIVDLRPEVLGLARGYGPLAVLRAEVEGPTRTFAPLAPALRLEHGKGVDVHGAERTHHFLERRLIEPALPHALPGALQLFVCVAKVELAREHAFAFGTHAPLQLRADLATQNFRRLAAGTLFARQDSGPLGLCVTDTEGRDVTAQYLDLARGEIRLRREVFPADYTDDVVLVRERGLCYLLQPFERRFASTAA